MHGIIAIHRTRRACVWFVVFIELAIFLTLAERAAAQIEPAVKDQASDAAANDSAATETTTNTYPVVVYPGPSDSRKAQTNLLRTYLKDGSDEVVQAALNDLVTRFASDRETLAKFLKDWGKKYQDAGRPACAIQFYRALLDRFPENQYVPKAKFELARIYILKGDMTQADSMINELVSDNIKPADYEAIGRLMFSMAETYSDKLRDHDKANRIYQRLSERFSSIADDSNHSDQQLCALWIVARSQFMLEHYEASRTAADRMMSEFSNSTTLPILLAELARDYNGKRHSSDARAVSEFALKLNPPADQALPLLALLATMDYQVGDLAKGNDTVDRIIADYSHNKNINNEMLRILRRLSRSNDIEAINAICSRYIERRPDNPQIMQFFMYLSSSYTKLGNPVAADNAYRTLFEKYSSTVDLSNIDDPSLDETKLSAVVYDMGLRFREAGQYAKSLEILTKYIVKWPHGSNFLEAQTEIAISSFWLGDLIREKQAVDAILAETPFQDPRLKKIMFHVAVQHYEKTLALITSQDDKYRGSLNRTEELFDIYNEQYSDPEGYLFKAYCLQIKLDFAKASEYYRRVIDLSSSSVNLNYAHLGLANCYWHSLLSSGGAYGGEYSENIESEYQKILADKGASKDSRLSARKGLASIYSNRLNPEDRAVRYTKFLNMIQQMHADGENEDAETIYSTFIHQFEY